MHESMGNLRAPTNYECPYTKHFEYVLESLLTLGLRCAREGKPVVYKQCEKGSVPEAVR